jgi:hypothetical protein
MPALVAGTSGHPNKVEIEEGPGYLLPKSEGHTTHTHTEEAHKEVLRNTIRKRRKELG